MASPSIDGFELSATLYEGPRSTVWRGTRTADGRPVVIKLLTAPSPSHADLTRYRYSKEVTDGLALDGVAEYLDLLEVDGRPVLVSEDIGARSLSQWIAQGAVRSRLVASLAAVAETLGRLHSAGVIHRDINPANIVTNPEIGRTLLIDFELASPVPRQRVEARPPTSLEGTLAYIAPEQTGRTGRPADHRADLYSLGVSLYEALTGRRPFDAPDRLGLVHAHLAEEPRDPRELDPTVPGPLAEIALKLLEKDPADRYQSGFGVAADLRRCAADLAHGQLPIFELGSADLPPTLQLGQNLFGRDREKATLLAAFERAASGRVEGLLVAGYSGVGKSSLVMEIQGAVGRAGGRFVEGKYDQLTNVPFTAWLQVVRGLVRAALADEEERLAALRDRTRAAVGANGRAIIDFAPEAEHLLGDQPALLSLPAAEAENRLRQVFARFLGAFATDEQPIVVFLDDLQWADRPSLTLLERLVADPEGAHLLLIGAYRENEVPEGHPLLRSVSKLQEVDAPLTTLGLRPLSGVATARLVAAAVGQSVDAVGPLADAVFDRTRGNPFFAERLLMTLADDGLLSQADGAWTWDVDGIEDIGFAENVVDLMARRIGRLAPDGRDVLRVAAAIGGRFELKLVAALLDRPAEDVASSLWDAMRESLVVPRGGAFRYAAHTSQELLAEHPGAARVEYAFVHDRIQEAAWAQTSEEARPALHLAIGRALQAEGPEHDEALFAVATQLVRGLAALPDDERCEVRGVLVHAGGRALAAAAWPAALEFFDAAKGLFEADAWASAYEHRFAVARGEAQATRLLGDFDRSRAACRAAFANGRDVGDRVRAQLDLINVTSIEGDHAASVETGLLAMEQLGFERPADEAGWGALGGEEGAKLMAAIGEGGVDALADLPAMTDERVQLETEILAAMVAPASTMPHVYGVVTTRFARLFAEHGLGPLAAQAFVGLGLLNAFMRDYDSAETFGRLGVRLSDEPAYAGPRAAALMLYSCWVAHWKHPLEEAARLAREALDVGAATGSFDWGGWAGMNLPQLWIAGGLELERAVARTRELIATSRNVFQFDDAAWIACGGLHAMLRLMGRGDELAALDEAGLSEASLRERLAHYPMALGPMFTGRLWSALMLGEPEVAAHCIEQGKPFVLFGGGLCHVADFVFLEALFALTRADGELDAADREIVDAALPQLDSWAGHCAANHGCKPPLLRAELARRDGADPGEFYEQAIEAAQTAGLPHHVALCLERAGCWLASEGRGRAARGYLEDARVALLRWGATAAAERLSREHPLLSARATVTGSFTRVTTTETLATVTGSSDLDADALLKAMTAISTELRLDEMLRAVMRTVLEVAGAQRGSLLLVRNGIPQLAAQAEADGIELSPRPAALPYSDAIVRYVLRTRGQVVLADATSDRRFAGDRYVRARRPRSVLCQAVVKQHSPLAVLYLENNLATDGFTESRCRMTSVLSSQAAVSLENSLLFEEQRELNESMQRFLPSEFLSTLGHRNVTEIRLGQAVEREMTVLFTDIRQFTSISQRMSPSEIFAYLNAYLGRVGPIIRAQGGFIDKYIGDAIMALFPTARDAVEAAREIVLEVEAHNELLELRGEPTMSVGIGMHRGRLMLGTIGESQRMDSTVISDAVNIASRVESLTKTLGAAVLLTGEVAERLDGDVPLRSLGSHRLRGRAGTMEIFAIDG